MYIYLASSWRNQVYEEVLEALRSLDGHQIHDFRDPAGYFSWADLDPNWPNWDVFEFNENLRSPKAAVGFDRDFAGMEKCDLLVLLLPCGRSAHLEAGWALGQGKPVIIAALDSVGLEAELMYKMTGAVVDTIEGLLEMVQVIGRKS